MVIFWLTGCLRGGMAKAIPYVLHHLAASPQGQTHRPPSRKNLHNASALTANGKAYARFFLHLFETTK